MMERVENPQLPQQQAEWAAAQTIVQLTTDLVPAARRQLRFLAAVDRLHRALYRDGPALRRAIHRYKNCWLPLLAKHGDLDTGADASGLDPPLPLAVPLDCEWIWHCHRLNPVQYKKDCEKVYGRILDNRNVVGPVVDGELPSHSMLQLWQQLYPDEPFEFDSAAFISDDASSNNNDDGDKLLPEGDDGGGFDYDLAAAAERQSSFYYQVSRPTLQDVRTLEAAAARYKGFLYLIKRNQERAIKRFCVPTYDIDIVWHSHQLHPVSYCNDLMKLVGRVLEHDDTDSDRSKGMKLDVGFSEFTKQWENEFGYRYWRAGAMYRGSTPSPVALVPFKGVACSDIPLKHDAKGLQLSDTKIVEVLLQVVSITNLPASLEGKLFVSFGKSQPDMFLQGNCPLDIQSLIGDKQVASFKCEPKDDLVLILMSKGTTYLPVSTPTKAIGKISISLQHLVDPTSELTIEKEFKLKLNSAYSKLKPIHMHVAASFTVPVPAPHELYLVKSGPFSRNPCFIPSPGSVLQMRRGSCLIDVTGNVLLDVNIRHLKKTQANVASISKQVVGLMKASGKKCVLAEFAKDEWNLLDTQFVLSLKSGISEDGQIFELKGEHQVKLFIGRKLEFDPKTCKCEKNNDEKDYITFVHFSETDPYGKALALVNLRSGLVKINEGWFVLPGVVLAFILSHLLKREGYVSFSSGMAADKTRCTEISTTEKVDEDPHSLTREVKMVSGTTPAKGGKCGSSCSGSCGASRITMAKGGKCSSTCSGSCGMAPAKAGKCGSKCSGSCGGISSVLPNNSDILTKQQQEQHSSGCGSGCGGSGGCKGGCDNVANKNSNCGGSGGGCNGDCGGGCGEVAKRVACWS